MSYWDTAYVAKFYLDEPESERVRELADAEGVGICSRFGYLETVSVFQRKLREGTIRDWQLRELCEQLDDDSEAGVWSWLPVSQAVLTLASATLRRLPKGVILRAGDALHLATAQANGIATIFSNDTRLLKAAPYFQVSGRNPSAKKS